MADNDIRVCPCCGGIYVEDSVLSVDPDICPNCGCDLKEYADRGTGDEPCN
jgi:hypothetical protein